MSNLEYISKELTKGNTVYLFDEFEEVVLKLFKSSDKTTAFVKFKGREEYEVSPSAKLVFDVELAGSIVNENFYNNY